MMNYDRGNELPLQGRRPITYFPGTEDVAKVAAKVFLIITYGDSHLPKGT